MGRQGQLCGSSERYGRHTGQVTSADKDSRACFSASAVTAGEAPVPNKTEKGIKRAVKHSNTARRAPFAAVCA